MAMIGIGFIICLASTGRGVPGVMYFGIFVAVVGKYIQVTNIRILIPQLTHQKESTQLSPETSHGSV
jgi:hypothetical protein